MSAVTDTWDWLTTADHWSGPQGIPARLWEHLQYSALALVIAAVIALPLGLIIGHTRRGANLAVALSGVPRAIPTLGILVLLFRQDPLALWTGIVPLVVLAIPPILANTVVGIEGVDPAVRDAAEGMGMRASGVLFGVEIPLGLALVVSGIRSAASQVIATATIIAYGGLGGLGRFIIDGFANRDFGQMYGGAIIVAAVALVVEGVLALLQRAAGRHRSSTSRAEPTTVDPNLDLARQISEVRRPVVMPQ
jgi:osmoprotectant transport system permease protein